MDKIRMKCDRCSFETVVNTPNKDETEAKVPFYRCPKCNIGSLKEVKDKSISE